MIVSRHPRILMLGWEFPPQINGGLGVACYGLAKALARSGVDLEVIVPKASLSKEKFKLTGLNNISIKDTVSSVSSYQYLNFARVHEISVKLNPYSGLATQEHIALTSDSRGISAESSSRQKSLFQEGGLYGEDLCEKVIEYSKVVTKLALSREFDLIHAHDWMTFLAGVEIKKATGKPLVVHVHSTEFDRGGGAKKNWIYRIEDYGFSKADAIIPVSRYTGDVLCNQFGVHPAKIFPIHNGIDRHRERVSKKRELNNPTVLFVGRLTKQKGPHHFLKIAQRVLKYQPNTRFVMVGTGEELEPLRDQVRSLGLGDRVSLTGFLQPDDVRRHFEKAAVYCMPSVSDPFGLTGLEAAQCKTPGVLSNQSGVTEVLKGALTADYWETEKMAEHVINLLTRKKLRKRLMKQAKSDLKKLTWKHSARRVRKVYDSLISEEF